MEPNKKNRNEMKPYTQSNIEYHATNGMMDFSIVYQITWNLTNGQTSKSQSQFQFK